MWIQLMCTDFQNYFDVGTFLVDHNEATEGPQLESVQTKRKPPSLAGSMLVTGKFATLKLETNSCDRELYAKISPLSEPM